MSNVKHISGEAGGYLVGRRHSTGGIKAINKSTGQPLEMEGGEVVITRNAVSDPTKRSFNGKMMTNREILSTINQSGGGVAFADGGEVPDNIYFDMDEEFEYGGKVYKGRDLPAKMTYGTELDDILDSALEEGDILEEGGNVGKSLVRKIKFYANGFDEPYTRNFQDIFSWVRVQNLKDAGEKTIGVSGELYRGDAINTDLVTPMETYFDLAQEFPSGTNMTDIINRLSKDFRYLLQDRMSDGTRDGLGYSEANINSMLASFASKVNPTIGALESVTIYQPSSDIKEVTSSFDDSSLIEIQDYDRFVDIWPKNPNYKGYESLMRKVIKGLPNYQKSEVVIKLRFRTLTAQDDGRAIGVVYVPVKLDMRKVKWSEIKKRIKDKLSWNVLLDSTGEKYHIVLDAPNWGMFESDEYTFNNSRENKARADKFFRALREFQDKHKDSGALNILTNNGLFTAQDNVEIDFDSSRFYIEIFIGETGSRNRVQSIDKDYARKGDFGISDTEIFYQHNRNGFFRFFLDNEAVEKIRKQNEEAQQAERERKAEELRLKKEAEEAERLRKEELANRPFQVRDQPEDEALFDGELMADTEERRLLLADIEAVKRLLKMAQGQALTDTRVALIRKLRKLQDKAQDLMVINESMDVESQKLISPIGLMNYYFTQARQNPTAKTGKPSGLPTPTGVPSKLDIQSYHAVRTRYFKRWFGDWELAAETGDYSDCSIMVDSDTKEPRLMYHGVRKYIKGIQTGAMGSGVQRPFGTFKAPNFPATYFGDDINYVKFYAGMAENMPRPNKDYEGFIYTTFINMRRPVFIDDLGEKSTYADLLAHIALKYGVVIPPTSSIANKAQGQNKVWNYIRQDVDLINALKKKGFDGIIQVGDVPKFDKSGNPMVGKAYWATEYLVFEPTQVKSATVKKSFYLGFFDDVRFKDGGYVRI